MKKQLRGNCQCCGRDQAVVAGHMSKHGYEVKGGWFQGVCQGHQHRPIQVERTVADQIIASVRKEVVELRRRAADYESGKIVPTQAESGNWRLVRDPHTGSSRHVDEMVPFDEAPKHKQREALQKAIWQSKNRADSGESFADGHELLVNAKHGQPLTEVAVEAGPARIQAGEKRRIENGTILESEWQDGGRVYWFRITAEGKRVRSWMGTRSWRSLAPVDAEAAA